MKQRSVAHRLIKKIIAIIMKEESDILYPRKTLKNNGMNDEYKKKIIKIVGIGVLILVVCILVIFFVSKDADKLANKVETIRTQALLDQAFLKTYNLLLDQKKKHNS